MEIEIDKPDKPPAPARRTSTYKFDQFIEAHESKMALNNPPDPEEDNDIITQPL